MSETCTFTIHCLENEKNELLQLFEEATLWETYHGHSYHDAYYGEICLHESYDPREMAKELFSLTKDKNFLISHGPLSEELPGFGISWEGTQEIWDSYTFEYREPFKSYIFGDLTKIPREIFYQKYDYYLPNKVSTILRHFVLYWWAHKVYQHLRSDSFSEQEALEKEINDFVIKTNSFNSFSNEEFEQESTSFNECIEAFRSIQKDSPVPDILVSLCLMQRTPMNNLEEIYLYARDRFHSTKRMGALWLLTTLYCEMKEKHENSYE
ncbi:hypothetical protein GF420_15680 [candidate division GN15 bacterium]|nr:hypothetical protein [candidate division GN15 bacterium]